MSKFLAKLLLILIPFGIAVAYAEVMISKVPNTYSKKRKYFLQQADSVEVIVTGTSHGFYGIDPACFSLRGFNLAGSSQDLYYDRELVLHNLNKLPRVKIAIVPISYVSFFILCTNGPEEWREAYYKRYWGVCYKKFPIELAYYSHLAMYGHDIRIREIKAGFKEDLAPNVTNTGFIKMDTSHILERVSESSGIARVKTHERYFKEKYMPQTLSYVSDMIEELQKKGVKVVLITTPTLPTYYRHLNSAYYTKMQGAITFLCRKYGLGYIDYTKDPRLQLSDFYDNDHLNFIGAQHFARILDTEIIQKTLHK